MSPKARSRRSITEARVRRKLVRALKAKTPKRRANYIIDAVFDEALENPYLDEFFHFFVESAGAGAEGEGVERWARKFLKYRASRWTP
jgi:hypothetical protein